MTNFNPPTPSRASKAVDLVVGSTGERRLFDYMRGQGWIFRRDGRWRAMQRLGGGGQLALAVVAE